MGRFIATFGGVLAFVVAVVGNPVPNKHTRAVDYVIVGGGPAGFVLTERLSRDPNTQVVLLEAGPDGINVDEINTPAYYPLLTPYVWNYTTIPDPNLGGNTPQLNQGRVFGGGTGVNGMAYCRGSASVFDEWAAVSGNNGLAWSSMLQEFRETSRYEYQPTSVDYPENVNISGYGNGPMEISRSVGDGTTGFDIPFGKALESTFNLPVKDLTDGTGIGVNYGLSNIFVNDRTRSYSRNTFGVLAQSRPNVKLISGAWVHSIGFTGKTARDVTYLNATDQESYTIAAKEIIVSGGAINTPKLLLQNGIGPKKTLSALSIPVVADIAEVGQNLYDHLFPIVEAKVSNDVITVWQWYSNATAAAQYKEQYANRSGPLSWDNGLVYGAFRVPDSVFDGVNGSHYLNLPQDRPHVLLEYSTVPFDGDVGNTSVVTAWASLVQPEAAGYVSINSRDFRKDPVIFSNYYGSPADKAAVKWAYKKLRELISSEALSAVVEKELYPGADVTSDDDVWKAIQNQSYSFHHPVGTCAIGKVLNPDWRIKGLNGIRVVDSSAFPYLPTCHTQAAVYALASRAAKDIIAADNKHRR